MELKKVKQCPRCKLFSFLDEYPEDKSRSSGFYPVCKDCKNKDARRDYHAKGEKRIRPQTENSIKWHREYHIKKKYGLTAEQHKELYLKQDGRCKICEKLVEYEKLHTDHDHATGIIRGLLCSRCNQGMSYFDDDNFMEKATDYVA